MNEHCKGGMLVQHWHCAVLDVFSDDPEEGCECELEAQMENDAEEME